MSCAFILVLDSVGVDSAPDAERSRRSLIVWDLPSPQAHSTWPAVLADAGVVLLDRPRAALAIAFRKTIRAVWPTR